MTYDPREVTLPRRHGAKYTTNLVCSILRYDTAAWGPVRPGHGSGEMIDPSMSNSVCFLIQRRTHISETMRQGRPSRFPRGSAIMSSH